MTEKKRGCVVLLVLAVSALVFIYRIVNPPSQNYVLLVNQGGTDVSNPLKFVLREDRGNLVEMEGIHLGSTQGSCRIIPYEEVFFGGELTIVDSLGAVVYRGAFHPPGRYQRTAVVEFGATDPRGVRWDVVDLFPATEEELLIDQE